MRLAFAAVCLLAVSPALAQFSLELPNTPDRNAVVRVVDAVGSLVSELRRPAAYDPGNSATPMFGRSGDIDGDLALIGAPEVWGQGSAFVFNAETGALVSTLLPGIFLDGGRSRPQFGRTVDIDGGLAVVTAPLAGANMFGPGIAIVFDALTGDPLQYIYNPTRTFSYIGGAVINGGFVDLAITSYADSSVETFRVALVPEPGAMLLALFGVAASCCRRCC